MIRRSMCLATALAATSVLGCGSTSPSHEDANTTPDAAPPTTTDAGGPKGPCGVGTPTQFAGDDRCLPAPGPDEGVQMHIGPKDYDDPDELGTLGADGKSVWLMEPGDERVSCYHLYTGNTDGRYYFKQQYRMRPGSHHMIIQGSDNTDAPEGWGPCTSSIINAIGGTQRTVEDLPPGGIVAPEDEGLGRGLEPHTPLDFQLHFYNNGEEATLREVWVNFLYKPKEEVKTNLGMLGGFIIPMNIPPHTQKNVTNYCKAEQAINADSPVRVVTLFGHAHIHNKRFAVWKENQDGTDSELVYDSYDGAEAPTYTYNTTATLPTPDADARISGGKSGILSLDPGQQLRFECDVDNNTDNTFFGRNEVANDEMCNLFGSVAGAGFPCFDLSKVTGGMNVKPPAMP